jgi:CubicO group peptidase (beta-lactamase class C family)
LAEETRQEAFESQVDDLRARLRIPGLSVAVVEDQKVVWAKGFGYADYENRIPATPDTVYHIASETKPFAATLVMQLVEQGKMGFRKFAASITRSSTPSAFTSPAPLTA